MWDSSASDFNVVVYARETLAELDFTLFHCEFQLNLTRSDGLPVKTAYRAALEKKDPRLFEDNFLLQQTEKDEYLKARDTAYGIRNRPKEGILEVEFTVFESPKDGDFTREAVRPVSQEELNGILRDADESK